MFVEASSPFPRIRFHPRTRLSANGFTFVQTLHNLKAMADSATGTFSANCRGKKKRSRDG